MLPLHWPRMIPLHWQFAVKSIRLEFVEICDSHVYICSTKVVLFC